MNFIVNWLLIFLNRWIGNKDWPGWNRQMGSAGSWLADRDSLYRAVCGFLPGYWPG